MKEVEVKAVSHITGGGFPIFKLMQRVGNISSTICTTPSTWASA